MPVDASGAGRLPRPMHGDVEITSLPSPRHGNPVEAQRGLVAEELPFAHPLPVLLAAADDRGPSRGGRVGIAPLSHSVEGRRELRSGERSSARSGGHSVGDGEGAVFEG